MSARVRHRLPGGLSISGTNVRQGERPIPVVQGALQGSGARPVDPQYATRRDDLQDALPHHAGSGRGNESGGDPESGAESSASHAAFALASRESNSAPLPAPHAGCRRRGWLRGHAHLPEYALHSIRTDALHDALPDAPPHAAPRPAHP